MAEVIVVGVDGSASSHEALRWAVADARRRGVALRVVTAYRFPLAFAGSGADPSLAAPDDQQRAEAKIDEALAVAGDLGDVAVDRRVLAGQAPGHGLVEAAADALLLVVGQRGLGGVSGFTLGSVSHYCVSHAQCPVVVVPEAPSVQAPS